MYGFDFGIHYHPHLLHRLHLESSLSYIKAIDHNGFHIDQIPPAKWRSKIKFEFDEKDKFYIKNVIVQNNLIFAQNEVAINETSSNLYNVLNVGINAILKTKNNKIEINAGVKNVLNTTYIDHLSNLKFLEIAGPGINFYFGLKYNINHKK
jgi:iron complex outermembrane receptor protein